MWEAGLLFCRRWECQHLSTQSFYCPSSLVYYLCVAILTYKWLHRTMNMLIFRDMKDIIVFAMCVCALSATCSLRYRHRANQKLLAMSWALIVCLFAGRISVCSKRRRCTCCCRRCTGPATAVKPSSAWTSAPFCSIWACSHAPDTLGTH